LLAVSPCGGWASPAWTVVLPPNGKQKKSPRNTRNNPGIEGKGCSFHHGAMANGWIERRPSLNVTGARCPPVRVTAALTRSVATT